MYDDTDLSLIPAMPHAVAAYINGSFANYEEARKRFPHARILSISVTGDVAADCYDLEKGDYPYDQAGHLFTIARDGGIWRPCFYFELTARQMVQDSLASQVKDAKEVRQWVAYWNGHTDLPSWADAHQFTNRALGRNLDESICRDDFFQPAKPPADRTMRATVAFDADSGNWTVEPAPAGTTPS
jgi:hypothetical protein